MPNSAAPIATGTWFAGVVEALFREFEDRYSLTTIHSVARQCREQLSGSPEFALPELVDRLARQRLGAGLSQTPPSI